MLNHSNALDDVFKALAEPTRRAIIECLSQSPMSVGDLAALFPMTLTAVLQHVQQLERSGLVSTTKAGRTRICRIDAETLEMVEQWLGRRREIWEHRANQLDRLGELLADAVEAAVLEPPEGSSKP